MATNAAAIAHPLATVEYNPFTVTQPSQQPEDLAPITSHPSTTPLQLSEVQTLPPAVAAAPAFIHSITQLKELSTTINSFQQCYDDLFNHIDSIRTAILSKLQPETENLGVIPPPSSPRYGEKIEVCLDKELPAQQFSENSPEMELEGLCRAMSGRGVKKYLLTRLSDRAKLLEEVPKALKMAPNPGKLVLECVGKFFSQGSKAFAKDSPLIQSREASIFVLECFLLMMGMNDTDGNRNHNGALEVENTVKQEAEAAALAWRKRMLAEGGIAKCSQVDVRGLLMFVACFGFPTPFKREDIRDLIVVASAKEIAGVLKCSRMVMDKIPEIVEEMLKNKMEVDAVDIAFTFGFEERFNPQSILSSFLRGSKEASENAKRTQGTTVQQNEANKNQLAALKSVSRCLEKHKVDAAKILPGWHISEKISSLEKAIADLDRKTTQKRKTSESEAYKRLKSQEAKRSRFTLHGPQQQKPYGHADSRRIFLDSTHPSHASHYSTTQPVGYGGPGAGMLPEIMHPPGVGVSLSTTRGGTLSAGSYASVHGVPFDPSVQVMSHTQPNVWLRDEALIDKYASQPSVGLTTLYRSSTSVEGSGKVPSTSFGVGGHGSASDLYHFADSVAESESYPRNVAAMSNTVPPQHSSYLYK